jgi:pSer/pThr/pTyr-binding forkhead associated (FHA) protein
VSLLGRQPAAHADHPGATLVRLDDPTRSISRTHLALGCGADGALWARDLNSANGTLIVDQRGVTTKAPPGVPLYLVPGSWVVVGGLTLQVIS